MHDICTYTTSTAKCNGFSPENRIYVGYESASIIRHLDPMTGELHTARFADCIFDEDNFPSLGGAKEPLDEKCREIIWQSTGIPAHDPRTKEANLEA
jgi:hypothetical protein